MPAGKAGVHPRPRPGITASRRRPGRPGGCGQRQDHAADRRRPDPRRPEGLADNVRGASPVSPGSVVRLCRPDLRLAGFGELRGRGPRPARGAGVRSRPHLPADRRLAHPAARLGHRHERRRERCPEDPRQGHPARTCHAAVEPGPVRRTRPAGGAAGAPRQQLRPVARLPRYRAGRHPLLPVRAPRCRQPGAAHHPAASRQLRRGAGASPVRRGRAAVRVPAIRQRAVPRFPRPEGGVARLPWRPRGGVGRPQRHAAPARPVADRRRRAAVAAGLHPYAADRARGAGRP